MLLHELELSLILLNRIAGESVDHYSAALLSHLEVNQTYRGCLS